MKTVSRIRTNTGATAAAIQPGRADSGTNRFTKREDRMAPTRTESTVGRREMKYCTPTSMPMNISTCLTPARFSAGTPEKSKNHGPGTKATTKGSE